MHCLKKDNQCNEFEVIANEGIFNIYCDINSNIYWSPSIYDMLVSSSEYKYTLNKDDRYAYNIFNKLYDDIIHSDASCENVQLIENGKINWHSDCFDYDAASVLTISKDEYDNFIIHFRTSKMVLDDVSSFVSPAVQINITNSRYAPYHRAFIDMYESLEKMKIFPENVIHKMQSLKKERVRKR